MGDEWIDEDYDIEYELPDDFDPGEIPAWVLEGSSGAGGGGGGIDEFTVLLLVVGAVIVTVWLMSRKDAGGDDTPTPDYIDRGAGTGEY